METISRQIMETEDGSTVRHILKAKLHFSSHAISRLTRTPTGILVNGRHARTVDILHTGDILTVETGDSVKLGQEIAAVGSTGLSTGPHLHFEVRQEGEAQNPVAFFDAQVRDTLKME